MKNPFLLIAKNKSSFLLAVAVVFFSASLFNTKAQTVTFAQFNENDAQGFVFTNNTSNATFNTISGGAAVSFRYVTNPPNSSGIVGLPPSLTGFQDAHLIMTATTTTPATSGGGNTTQPLSGTITISIIRDTPAPVLTGTGSRTNLLTAVITVSSSTADITGGTGGQSATLSASTTPQNVVYTSDFISFATTTQRNLGISFSAVTPGVTLGAGNFLQNFAADATGTFASNPIPVYVPPTAASVAIGGRVVSESGSGLRSATVTLTEANGTVHQTTTGSFGRYEFTGIEIGQTVIIGVNSKRYRYAPRIINLQDNLADFDLYPEL